MKITLDYRSTVFRALALCVGLGLLIVFAAGCCTVKVKPEHGKKILLIVKQKNNLSDPERIPAGALIGAPILRDGDKLVVVNRFGSKVKVVFEPGVIVGDDDFFLERCGQREVTITLTDPEKTSINVQFDEIGGGHGGADMVVEPPGGG